MKLLDISKIKIKISGYFKTEIDGFDCSAFIFNKERSKPEFVFYNNRICKSGAIKLLCDDESPWREEEESSYFEELILDFEGIEFSIDKILLVLSIYNAKNIHIGLSYFKEIKIELFNYSTNTLISTESIKIYNLVANTIELCQFVKVDNIWGYELINHQSEGELDELVKKYC